MRVIEPEALAGFEERFPLFFQVNYAAYELKRGWTVILIADEESAVIPLKVKKGRYIKQGQYLYPPFKNGERLSSSRELEFLTKLLSFCRQLGLCDFIAPPLHFSLFQSVPPNSYYTEMGIIALTMPKTDEELMAGFASSCRNKIRKAITGGVQVKFDNKLFDRFYEVYKQIHEKQNIYYDSREDLLQLTNSLGERNYKIVSASIGDEIYSAALVLLNGNEAYYYQSGTAENNPNPGINNLLQFEIMKWLRQEGITRYCMGGYRPGDIKGSKYEGIQNFKLSFGAQVEKGYHFYSKVSWKYPAYQSLLRWYLRLKGVPQNYTGLDYKYN